MRINRFLPLIVPLSLLCLLEFFYFEPAFVYVVFIFIVGIYFFAFKQLCQGSKTKEKWYNVFLLPFNITSSVMAISMMIPITGFWGKFVIQSIIIFNVVLVYYYFRFIYYYLYNINKHQDHLIVNSASYGNFIAFYFIATAIYGLNLFLNVSIWILMLLMITMLSFIIYQVMWANQIDFKKGLLYLVIIIMALVEVAWSISFLTLSFYIQGLILAVCYYILIGIVRFYLTDSLNKKLVKMYLSFGFLSILAVLLTARWI